MVKLTSNSRFKIQKPLNSKELGGFLLAIYKFREVLPLFFPYKQKLLYL